MIGKLFGWLADRFAKEKHVIARSFDNDLYLTRWVLSRQRSQGVGGAAYLHCFHRSDADEMHDHPWPFVSIILAGGYWEVTPAAGWSNGAGPTKRVWYGPGRVLHRPARWIHSVVIPDGCQSWSLVIRGPKERSWGFWCPLLGYLPWREHERNAKKTGRGCETSS